MAESHGLNHSAQGASNGQTGPYYDLRPSTKRELPRLTPGTLYLVATPIGNLEDITLRALRVLRQCDVIAAEDTRRTLQLLRHYQIQKPLLSCHAHNEARRAAEVVARLREGAIVALVTDAGSPGVSDPGERIVRATWEAGYRVEPVPGPCALVAALSASGLPGHRFHFVGFLPHKPGPRRRLIETVLSTPATLVIYESPHRIERLLQELATLCPDRLIVLARELTKKHEQFLRGRACEMLERARAQKIQGECVVLVEPPPTISEPIES
ncbi:MAG: 16S rRNA (cytidine(1402)-2'-O)-methyltransferase [Verrucomicrobiota bacterium]|nr:16S rRNA (cytidine(1402)-2'-O)-methyltransferase [Limisphaera sp.]MDW8380786.1 16S rRNA (cytidine(1402)-2'-O)-methyltransferase [Verrucomicrobiota bacterium]